MNERTVTADHRLSHPFKGPGVVANGLADIKLRAAEVVSSFSVRAQNTRLFKLSPQMKI